jgi:hypothetical protein
MDGLVFWAAAGAEGDAAADATAIATNERPINDRVGMNVHPRQLSERRS